MRVAVVVSLLLATLWANPAAAQNRRPTAVDFSAEWIGFADDGIVSENVVGGGVDVGVGWEAHLRIKGFVGPRLWR
jgi:hypothetical protein